MNDSTREISPLRQRMPEDMRLRKLAPKPQGRLHPQRAPTGGLSATSARHRTGRHRTTLTKTRRRCFPNEYREADARRVRWGPVSSSTGRSESPQDQRRDVQMSDSVTATLKSQPTRTCRLLLSIATFLAPIVVKFAARLEFVAVRYLLTRREVRPKRSRHRPGAPVAPPIRPVHTPCRRAATSTCRPM
jgi:hypothetical protein